MIYASKRSRRGSKTSTSSDDSHLTVVVASKGDDDEEKMFQQQQYEVPKQVQIPPAFLLRRSGVENTPHHLRLGFWTHKLLATPCRRVQMTEDMRRVNVVLQSDQLRRELIDALLKTQTDFTVKIRFCSAVDKLYLVTNKEERRCMEDALVELFLTPSSMFCISTLSKARARAIVNGHCHELGNAKLEVLEELSKAQQVRDAVDQIYYRHQL